MKNRKLLLSLLPWSLVLVLCFSAQAHTKKITLPEVILHNAFVEQEQEVPSAVFGNVQLPVLAPRPKATMPEVVVADIVAEQEQEVPSAVFSDIQLPVAVAKPKPAALQLVDQVFSEQEQEVPGAVFDSVQLPAPTPRPKPAMPEVVVLDSYVEQEQEMPSAVFDSVQLPVPVPKPKPIANNKISKPAVVVQASAEQEQEMPGAVFDSVQLPTPVPVPVAKPKPAVNKISAPTVVVPAEQEQELPSSVVTSLQLPKPEPVAPPKPPSHKPSATQAPKPVAKPVVKPGAKPSVKPAKPVVYKPLPSFTVGANEFEEASHVVVSDLASSHEKPAVTGVASAVDYEVAMPEVVVNDLSVDYEGNVVGGQASVGDQAFEFSIIDNQVAIPEAIFYDFFDVSRPTDQQQISKPKPKQQRPKPKPAQSVVVAKPTVESAQTITINRDQLREEIRVVLQEFLQQALASLGEQTSDGTRLVLKPVLMQQTAVAQERATEMVTPQDFDYESTYFEQAPTERAASTPMAIAAVDVGPTVFGGTDRFFLGFASDESTLVRASLGTSTEGQKIVQTTPMVSEAGGFLFNGSAFDVATNPLKDAGTAHLALAGSDKKLVVVPIGDPAIFDPMAGLDALAVAKNQHGASVYLLPVDDGSRVITHSDLTGGDAEFIKDAAGVSINQQIVALAASQPDQLDKALIFAAVADGALTAELKDASTAILVNMDSLKTWASDTVVDTGMTKLIYDGATDVSVIDGVNRGIAVLKFARDGAGNALEALQVVTHDATKLSSARKLRVDAESDGSIRKIGVTEKPAQTLAFYAPGDQEPITRALIGADVDMFWDEPLQRLYVGLSDVTRGHEIGAVTDKSGGVCSVMVGQVDDANQKITLYPVIKNPSAYLFADDRDPDHAPGTPADTGNFNKYILGFYEKNTKAEDLFASARAVRTMHTSTGKSYLIVNGGVGSRTNNPRNVSTQVYAVPLADDGWVGAFDKTSSAVKPIDFAPTFEMVRTNVEVAVAEVDGLVSGNRKTATTAIKNQNPPDTANAIASTVLEEVYKFDKRVTAANAVQVRVADLGITNPVTVAANKVVGTSAGGIAGAILADRIRDVSAKTTLNAAAKKAKKGTAHTKDGGAAGAIHAGAGWALHQAYEGTFRNDFLQEVKTMHLNSQERNIVGADPQLLSFDLQLTLTDIQVHGDTIYVSVAGDRDVEHRGEAGIFASKALFDDTGMIRAWTPWQRVMGRPDKVYGFDFDDQTSNFWFVTEDADKKINTVRVTEWGKGDNALHSDTQTMDAPLSAVLDAAFADVGGVLGLHDFSPDTYGFKERDPNSATQELRYEQFGMMVATGHGRVALIETGRFANNVFAPTAPFISDPNSEVSVRIFSASDADGASVALGQLGAITCAEVAQLPLSDAAANTGRLFVGGQHGVAVFTQGFTGKGWDTRASLGLSKFSNSAGTATFPRGKNWRFLQLLSLDTTTGKTTNIFKNVRRIVSDQNKFLYILTRDALYRIDMTKVETSGRSIFEQDAVTRSQAHIKESNLVKVASISESTDGAGTKLFDSELDEFFDVMVLKRDARGSVAPINLANNQTTLLLATTRGLYANTPATLTDNYKNKMPMTIETIAWALQKDLGPTLMFEFYAKSRGNRMVQDVNQPDATKKVNVFTAEGNLYTFALDKNKEFLARYRFNVNDGAIKQIKEPYVDSAGMKTDYFFKVGSFEEPVTDAEFLGPLDLYARTKHFGGDNFVNSIPVRPESSKFIKDPITGEFTEIDFDLSLSLPLQQARLVQDSASGAVYVPGEFGVRVNE
ncbi:hypothetical protein K2W90_06255 [Candidatus Babeliales bacterium]|nr:hypothetical protein [Candidatus Babeliales bacterium]